MESRGYARGHRILEIASIGLFLSGIVWLAFRAARTIDSAAGILWLALAGLAGFLSADFISGVFHWAGDTLGDESTPLVGPNFIRPFREHHTDEKGITHHDFVETNGNNCIISLPVVLALMILMPKAPDLLFYGSMALAFTTWFVFCTNQFHKWAHDDHAPAAVKTLQRWRLILSPTHHAIHHAPPHDKYYCITVGWMNPVLYKLRFFRLCEAVVARISPTFLADREGRR